MRASSRLIESYIIAALLPYLGLALLLLTAALLTQQTGRITELLGAATPPLSIATDIILGILPGVLLFTLPMAMLIGTATGFSRLGSDSELTAMRAAGVSTLRLVAPVVLLGTALTLAALYNGTQVIPAAARLMRQTALRAALLKLDSPVEPNAFNTELPGKVIYVREGDTKLGIWGGVFIYWREGDNQTRIVTARTGRIDSSTAQSELVLSDAVVTTLPDDFGRASTPAPQIVTEHSDQLRVRLRTGREALLGKLEAGTNELDELAWPDLWARTQEGPAQARRAARLTLHKRLALCCASLAFALLGAGLGLRARRGGRGLGMLLSLAAILIYYLLALGGEQLGRAEQLPPELAAWLATGAALLFGLVLLYTSDRGLYQVLRRRVGLAAGAAPVAPTTRAWRYALSGLLDRRTLRGLSFAFGLSFLTLVSVFLLFTAFELLRYLAVSHVPLTTFGAYLFYLLPLAGVNLAPVSVLIAVLATYALLARRSEVVAWWAAGQSTYRLALPGLVFACLVGGGLWFAQERVLPVANQRQEALRGRIRGGAFRGTTAAGRQWLALAATQRIYAYEFAATDSDLLKPVLFEFDAEGVHLRRIVSGLTGHEIGRSTLLLDQVVQLDLRAADGGLVQSRLERRPTLEITEVVPLDVFKPLLNKPIELNSRALRHYIELLGLQKGAELPPFTNALARRYTDPLAPLVMALLAVPLGIAFGKRGALAALSIAIVIGLTFWGTVSVFQQLGLAQLLSPYTAAWAPLLIFSTLGLYLLSKAKT